MVNTLSIELFNQIKNQMKYKEFMVMNNIITQFTNQEYINKYKENNTIKIYNKNYEIKII